jgi:PPE-repeat protein
LAATVRPPVIAANRAPLMSIAANLLKTPRDA